MSVCECVCVSVNFISTGDVAGLQNALFRSAVGLVGLVSCALEFLSRIGLELVLGCMSSVDMICKYVSVVFAVCDT